ncbi:hypothetical protein [Variovorax sp. 770b2]|uniref:hypothetical protein n=1 Tax=Variovorax sp. 770b2 TaxID=1566271 RepID=UPI0008EFF82A|nr:hypothetical protein [Variovorax sp. 770b2]SFQ34798.1 hypothetical protein SAMN03159339_6902 [Variovorax sp. 770b2]
MNHDLSNKTEYSVLQYYEYELRNSEHNKEYLVFNNALSTKFTVLAFPIKGKSIGYVAVLVNSEGTPETKVVPQADFVVTEKAYIAVKKETVLPSEIDKFIAAHVR